jgi:dGTPase
LYTDFDDPYNHFLYEEQSEILKFVFDDRSMPSDLPAGEKLNSFRSIECQIMDWADDTAYATNDLVDSISGGFITIIKLERWFKRNENELSESQKTYYNEVVEWIRSNNYKAKFGSQIGMCVQTCKLEERETFMNDLTNRYKYELILDKDSVERIELYKRIAVELVFQSSQLHQMEYKGDMMLRGIFETMENNYIKEVRSTKLLPDFTDMLIRRENDYLKRARLVCDYIAGMTDGFAMTTYKRLFDPDYSSIKDYV